MAAGTFGQGSRIRRVACARLAHERAPTEAVAIGRALEERERERAEQRRLANLRQNKETTEPENYRLGETRDKVGEVTSLNVSIRVDSC